MNRPLSILLSACVAPLLIMAPAELSAGAPSEVVAPGLLVGLLSQQGDQLCDGTPKGQWINLRHEVGYVRVMPGKTKLERFDNLPVIVKGRPVPGYRAPAVVHKGQCPPPMQMRADWTQGLKGMRIKRGPGTGFAAFELATIKPWSGIAIKRQGDEVVLTLRNDLGVDIRHLTMRLHYEGCYGKPGTMVRSETRPILRHGDSTTARFPAIAWRKIRKSKRAHAAAALTLHAQSPGIAFDFNWSLFKAGARVSCPKITTR